MKSLNLALAVTAVCGFLVSAAPAAACEDGLVSNEGGSQHVARCVPVQAFRQVSVKEDNEEANVIEPRHKDDHDDECRDHKDKDDCKRRKKGDKHKKKKGKKGDKHKKKKGKKEKCEKEPKHPECRDEDDHDDHKHDDCHEDSKEERCKHLNEHHDDSHGEGKGDHHDEDCPEELRGGPNCPWFKHEEKHDECEREPHKPHCKKDKKEH
ncbi:hypothetical protein VC83_05562 [Pseudogymnoascus destructans]|uniref:Uncharacterized protein n=2 Tax=Pseudogymnoascus destructans TaxID=655981 RepID=L8GAZ8_PSED2|nr:uncharacterized protein VC83_05562 [Pseudogymnoascus destructans]ELR09191.1 hypothetical protein GMDG_03768 [Pseudogymnoascus destructans 20631-21]OAF57801.1 hypothetical protein VC83_05562 [Pseudogymnoascus destructans]